MKFFGKKNSNLLRMFSGRNLQTVLIETVVRFPATVASLLVSSGIWYFLIWLNHDNNGQQYFPNSDITSLSSELFGVTLSLMLGAVFGLALETLFENTKKTIQKRIGIVLAPLVFSALHYIWARGFEFESAEYIGYAFIHFTIAFSSLFIGQYWNSDKKNTDYTRYYLRVGGIIVQGYILGLLTLLLGFLGLFSVKTLFGVDFEITYANWAVFSFAQLGALYALANFPKSNDTNNEKIPFEAILRFNCTYILIPAVIVYFVILYAYSIKVLLNFHEWPEGIISWLIIGFSIIGYKTYALSFAINSDKKIIQLFRTWLPRVILPQLIMLFYAIGLRIGQYDLTMNRYFVVAFGIWLLGISLYLSIAKEKRLVVVPISLAILALVIGTGPWGVMSLPYTRQLAMLDANMEKVGILKNGVISPIDPIKFEKTDESIETLRSIQSGIEYICSYNMCRDIETKFAAQLQGKTTNYEYSSIKRSSRKGDTYISSWGASNMISEALGIQDILNSSPSANGYQSLYSNNSLNYSGVSPLSIAGYETIVNFDSNELFTFSVTSDGKGLQIQDKATLESEQFPIENFLQSLTKKNGSIDQKELTLVLRGKKHEFKFLFTSIYKFSNNLQTGGSDIGMSRSNKPTDSTMNFSGVVLIKKTQ